jgi:light-regulated signal transduction histidine kinase (bacteriophytochrome)
MQSLHAQLDIAPVALGELVRETVADLETLAVARCVRLIATVTDARCVLETDRARLKTLLATLVASAVKSTGNGEVWVTMQTNPKSGRALRIDVADAGIGVIADRLDAPVEGSPQSDATASWEHACAPELTSRALAQLLGYDLAVACLPGVGSTFSIVLSPM